MMIRDESLIVELQALAVIVLLLINIVVVKIAFSCNQLFLDNQLIVFLDSSCWLLSIELGLCACLSTCVCANCVTTSGCRGK